MQQLKSATIGVFFGGEDRSIEVGHADVAQAVERLGYFGLVAHYGYVCGTCGAFLVEHRSVGGKGAVNR